MRRRFGAGLLPCLACALVVFGTLSVQAQGPWLEWAKRNEECTASRSNQVGDVAIWSYRWMVKREAERLGKPARYLQGFRNVIGRGDVLVVSARDHLLHINQTPYLYFDLSDPILTKVSDVQQAICLNNGMLPMECKNHNRVLLNSLTDESRYLECGTGAVRPYCHWRSFFNGTILNMPTPSADAICPYLPRSSLAVMTGNDVVFAGTFSVLEEAMISRSQPTLYTLQDTLWLDKPEFIASFEHGDFIYMILREVAQEVASESKVVSRIVRVCKNDRGNGGVFRSFLKLRVVCTNGGEVSDAFDFEMIASIAVMNGTLYDPNRQQLLLYATFHLPPGAPKGSAVCAYPMDEIVELFDNSPFLYNGKNNIWHERERDESADGCRKTSRVRDSMKYLYLKDHLRAKSIVMLKSIGVTSIVVHNDRPYDIFFLGTDDGEVLKIVRFLPKRDRRSYAPPGHKMLVVDRTKLANSSVTKMLMVSKLSLIVMTDDDFFRLPIVSCYWSKKSCFSCVATRDPYCGWCPDEEDVSFGGSCLPRSRCASLAGGPNNMRYFQDVEFGNKGICGPVVKIKALDERTRFIKDNSTVNITIGVYDATSVIWRIGPTIDMHPLPSKKRFTSLHLPEKRIAMLMISSALLKDKGLYTVEARNNVSSAFYTVELAVTAQAQIIGQPQSVLVTAGSVARFECRVRKRSSTRAYIVEWWYCPDTPTGVCDMRSLTLKPSETILQTKANTLVIVNAQPENVGTYQCRVVKDNTNVQSEHARLDIVEDNRMVEGSMELSVPMDIGSSNASLKLHCAITCLSDGVPPGWLFNGRVLKSPGHHCKCGGDTSRKCRSSLHLDASLSSGTYTCHTAVPRSSQEPLSASAFLTSIYVSHNADIQSDQMKVVLHCSTQQPHLRHTISCPGRRARESERTHWSQVSEDTSAAAAYVVTNSGDLRINQCQAMPTVTEFWCGLPDDNYNVTVEIAPVP